MARMVQHGRTTHTQVQNGVCCDADDKHHAARTALGKPVFCLCLPVCNCKYWEVQFHAKWQIY